MKAYIEERAVEIANYIIEHKATVRQAAKHYRDFKIDRSQGYHGPAVPGESGTCRQKPARLLM